jgi:DNA-directed RNA polymerase subunit RPC12/RpoP
MAKKSKKHTILGGIKVNSEQLSEWGSLGGRPKKYASTAEKSKAQRLRKKQEKFGEETQLRDYRSYGEIKIKRFITCPHCQTVNKDLRQYFTKEGELIKEIYWWSLEKGKHNIHENIYHCFKCSHTFSFIRGEIETNEIKKVIKKAGSSTERSRRSREKS